jgi:hypothetical protein
MYAAIRYNSKSQAIIEWFDTQIEAEIHLEEEAKSWYEGGDRPPLADEWVVVKTLKVGRINQIPLVGEEFVLEDPKPRRYEPKEPK